MRSRRLTYSSEAHPRLTHYVFRYPAKFHPPIARELLQRFSQPGEVVLDPFCGSGTLLVEAVATGRSAIGTDIDPVASFVANLKPHRYRMPHLLSSWESLQLRISTLRRPDYEALKFRDITSSDFTAALRGEDLWVPEIPNIEHWFRRYVIIDLARILQAIDTSSLPSTHRNFFRLCFAASLRSSSRADPVPVSGLEVTSHMRRLEAEGRLVNPFAEFDKAVLRALRGAQELSSSSAPTSRAYAYQADATSLRSHLRKTPHAVITSPPYQGAVEYYRRHTLEMYWLGFTRNHLDRLELLQQYVGRPKVPQQHPFVNRTSLPALAARWERRIRPHSRARADSFTHYVVAMGEFFTQLAEVLPRDAPAVFVLGRSKWNGSPIPTDKLFAELALDQFHLSDEFWYPVKNRYMSYSRHNGANIDRELVLVFRRR